MNIPLQKTIKILLVDDHQSFMDGLTMVINTLKPKLEIVGTVKSASELMAHLKEKEPDLILLDINLGETNGIDLLPDLIKQTAAKILILTGIHDSKLHEKAILSGAKGVLLKDESAKVILKAIQKVSEGEIWASKTVLGRAFEKFIHSPSNKNSEAKKIAVLTRREREIIVTLLSLESSTNKEIADHLFITESTLKNHLTTIYSKLEIKNRVQLMKYAITHHLSKLH